jgi:hypothetical protein
VSRVGRKRDTLYMPRELGAKLLRMAWVDESHVRAEPSARRRMQMEAKAPQ